MDDLTKVQIIQKVFGFATTSERNGWNRKRKNMQLIHARISQLESKWIDLQVKLIQTQKKAKNEPHVQEHIANIAQIESDINEYRAEIQPLQDEIKELREGMRVGCIHPIDSLLQDPTTGVVTCKFCERRMIIPNVTLADIEEQLKDIISDE